MGGECQNLLLSCKLNGWSKYFATFLLLHSWIQRSTSCISRKFLVYAQYLIGRSAWKTCENNISSLFQFQVWFKAVNKTKNHNHVEKVKCWRFALRYHFASCHSNRACWCPKCLGPRRLVIGTKGNCFEDFFCKW